MGLTQQNYVFLYGYSRCAMTVMPVLIWKLIVGESGERESKMLLLYTAHRFI